MEVERVSEPLIQVGDDETLGQSIHFPSVIRVPDWVNNPLGKYYLYFSHHYGEYIRLAYADSVMGSWSIYQPGALHLAETQFPDRTIGNKSRVEYKQPLLGELSNTLFQYYRTAANRLNHHVPLPHISSPEAYVDKENEKIRLYYHGLDSISNEQFTRVAVSDDGIRFESKSERLGSPYFRVFEWNGWYYALGQHLYSAAEGQRGVTVYRSKDGLTEFKCGPTILQQGVRHTGARVIGNRLEIYFTRIGDAPERILRSNIELSVNWNGWSPTGPVSVLCPETNYEGADCPLLTSTPGTPSGRVNQLRDPEVFTDINGDVWLFYSIAGESGIALAKLRENNLIY